MERALSDADEHLATCGEYLTESVLRRVIDEVRSESFTSEHPLQYLRRLAQDYMNEINRRGKHGNESSKNTYLTAVARLEDYNRTRKVPITSFNDFDRRFLSTLLIIFTITGSERSWKELYAEYSHQHTESSEKFAPSGLRQRGDQ